MTDIEITKLCAEASHFTVLGNSVVTPESAVICKHGRHGAIQYDPLHDDAQAMALVKKMNLMIVPPFGSKQWSVMGSHKEDEIVDNKDLNRAICECVAKMQKDKS